MLPGVCGLSWRRTLHLICPLRVRWSPLCIFTLPDRRYSHVLNTCADWQRERSDQFADWLLVFEKPAYGFFVDTMTQTKVLDSGPRTVTVTWQPPSPLAVEFSVVPSSAPGYPKLVGLYFELCVPPCMEAHAPLHVGVSLPCTLFSVSGVTLVSARGGGSKAFVCHVSKCGQEAYATFSEIGPPFFKPLYPLC